MLAVDAACRRRYGEGQVLFGVDFAVGAARS